MYDLILTMGAATVVLLAAMGAAAMGMGVEAWLSRREDAQDESEEAEEARATARKGGA